MKCIWSLSISLALSVVIGAGLAASAEPKVVTLPSERAFPESITSTTDGTLYVGSIAVGGVFRAKPGMASAESWIKPGAFGTRSIFGVLADEKSGTLWVCSNDLSALGITIPGADTGSFLKSFDLKTGVGKVSAKLPGDHTLCNDIAVAADGSVYATNTSAPQILKLTQSGDLEVWATDPRFQPAKGGGLDGIALGQDGNLYVDTFTPGELFRVDVKNGLAGIITKLQTSRALTMTDGMRPIGGTAFLMIEGSGKLDRVTVSGDAVIVETLKDGFSGPTGVTSVQGVAWVSEGQLPALFASGPDKKAPNLPFRVYGIPFTTH